MKQKRRRLTARSKWAWHQIVILDKALTARLTLSERARLRRKGATLGAHLGDTILWLPLALMALILGGAALREVVVISTLAAATSAGSVTLVKPLLRRKRPQAVMGHFFWKRFDRYSFPSGHAARTASIVVVLGANYPYYAPPLYVLPLIVGLSRVALGIHYISDILVGLAIGFLFSWAIVSFI